MLSCVWVINGPIRINPTWPEESRLMWFWFFFYYGLALIFTGNRIWAHRRNRLQTELIDRLPVTRFSLTPHFSRTISCISQCLQNPIKHIRPQPLSCLFFYTSVPFPPLTVRHHCKTAPQSVWWDLHGRCGTSQRSISLCRIPSSDQSEHPERCTWLPCYLSSERPQMDLRVRTHSDNTVISGTSH